MIKPYWTWVCPGCGHDDNRNTDQTCTRCGRKMTCREAGGSSWMAKNDRCDRGCCRIEKGTTDSWPVYEGFQ